jgi:hypothetical protein
VSVAGTDGGNDESAVTKRAVAAREQSWPLYFAGSQASYLQNIRRALARPELRS